MEEVWKDITLSSLHDQHSRPDYDFSAATPAALRLHHPPPAANFRSVILQDFLSSKDSAAAAATDTALFSSSAAAAAAHLPPPVLTLNSGRELAAHFGHSHCQQPISNGGSFHGPFDQVLGPPTTSGLSSAFGKKRVQDSDSNNSGDRRQKRMIKNRESAARSRARKQAYTNELELEVAHLMEENAKLRRQQEQLRVAAATQVPRKYKLHRTSTAPF